MGVQEASTGFYITKETIINTTKQLKNIKAVGEENIPTETIKIVLDKHTKVVVNLFNKICETVVMPNDWLATDFIPLPKKNYPGNVKNTGLLA